jgi:hypothetical protein
MSNEVCNDNRFETIAKAKGDILKNTNIEDSPGEMKFLDSFLFRCWQIGWLDAYYNQESEVAKLHDELDALNMRYLSQVSMYKSLYQEAKKELDELKENQKQ